MSSWHGAGSGVDSVSSWHGAGSGVDLVTSWTGAGSGVDFGADPVMAAMASKTTGLEMPAALAEINGGSSKLEASLKSLWPTRLRGSGLAAIP